ncbi:hypothetical protein TIFTF001_039248 [Ficus carica]|uniref:Uncharacterized protein n=1 Tax=Ficus carica TaxID=3494 RepID=A0AA88JDR0_FICCA|nr:hypothetical protein TIFTF001_039248 [Ficus carica]
MPTPSHSHTHLSLLGSHRHDMYSSLMDPGAEINYPLVPAHSDAPIGEEIKNDGSVVGLLPPRCIAPSGFHPLQEIPMLPLIGVWAVSQSQCD